MYAQPEMPPCLPGLVADYVDWLNESNEGLSALQSRLTQCNRDLNRIAARPLSEREALSLSFNASNPFDDPALYSSLTAVQRHAAIAARENCIPEAAREQLIRYSRQLSSLCEELAGYSRSLGQYAESGAWKSETDVQGAFALLTRCYVLFHDAASIRDALYFELSRLHRAYFVVQPDNAYERSTRALVEVFSPLRAILRALRQGNDTQIENNRARLEAAITRAREAGAALQGLPPQADAEFRAVLSLAGDFQTLVQELSRAPALPAPYAAYGKYYYYYNTRLLPLLNGQGKGEGIIARYNRICNRADVPILGAIEETGWLELQMPEVTAAPEPVVVPAAPQQVLPAPEAAPVAVPATLEGVRAVNLVLLVDVSASMAAPERLPLLQAAFRQLLDLMRPQDRLSIVVYSGAARVVLPPTSVLERNRILSAIEGLQSGGGSNVLEGTVAAYRMAERAFAEGGSNRIVLASDGYFSVPPAMRNLIEERAGRVQFSVFFFGEENPELADRMQRLATMGAGRYTHILPGNAREALLREARGD